MADPRIERYAALLVERCVDVQPGWQVLLHSSPPARPLVEEVLRLVARRGAYGLLRLSFGSGAPPETCWAEEAPEELLTELPPIERTAWETIDSLIVIQAPENLREGASLSPERQALIRRSMQPIMPRMLGGEVKWVGCQYPTPALAQEAGMTLRQFEEFLYGAVLIDWEELRREMERIAERFDAAETVRVVAGDTDVSFSLAGRRGEVDALGANLPGGEVFYSPVEDSAEGVVAFSEYPTQWGGREISGVRLRFEGGRAVEATAAANGDYLNQVLDTDVSFSLAGRRGEVDALGANLPGGEVFYSPVEDSAEGVVSFSEYPTQWGGREISGVRLRFEGGRVVEATAAANGDYLNQVLDTDEGARGLGEFGIGCNPGIQRHMKNTLFDEKIAGTVHFAVGAGFPFLGGTNESSVHWDMVKDLRRGGEIHCDGEVVQRDGQWLI